MNTQIRTAVVVTAIACLILVGTLLAGIETVAAGAKIIASTGFLAVAILSGALQSTYGKVLLAGLTLSFAGDALLIGETQQAFLAGLAAFLLAHLAYVAAFAVSGVNFRWLAGATLPACGWNSGRHRSMACTTYAARIVSAGTPVHHRYQRHGHRGVRHTRKRWLRADSRWCAAVLYVRPLRRRTTAGANGFSNLRLGTAALLRRSAVPGA